MWKSPVPPAGEEGSPEGCVPLALSAEDRGSKGQRPLDALRKGWNPYSPETKPSYSA